MVPCPPCWVTPLIGWADIGPFCVGPSGLLALRLELSEMPDHTKAAVLVILAGFVLLAWIALTLGSWATLAIPLSLVALGRIVSCILGR